MITGVPLRDMQDAMRHASRTTMRYDTSRANLDRHAGTPARRHAVAAYLAGMASG